jgi:hypothetical protein
MTDITIPPEALEAAKAAWYTNQHKGTDDRMSAACLAMLRSWPGMEYMMGDETFPFHHIILPLTEPSDDK